MLEHLDNPISDLFDSREFDNYMDDVREAVLDSFNEFMEEKYEDSEEFDDADLIIQFVNEEEIIENYLDVKNQDLIEWKNENKDELEEINLLLEFEEELKQNEEYSYGMTIISEHYFEDYVENLLEELGYNFKDFPCWIEIDWEETSNNVKQDYTEVNFEDTTYYFRN